MNHYMIDFEKIANGEEKYLISKSIKGATFAVAAGLLVPLSKYYNDKDKLSNLTKVMEQLDDDLLLHLYQSLRFFMNTEGVAAVALATLPLYTRVVEKNGRILSKEFS